MKDGNGGWQAGGGRVGDLVRSMYKCAGLLGHAVLSDERTGVSPYNTSLMYLRNHQVWRQKCHFNLMTWPSWWQLRCK